MVVSVGNTSNNISVTKYFIIFIDHLLIELARYNLININSILASNANSGAAVLQGLVGVLDLEDPAVRRELTWQRDHGASYMDKRSEMLF